ncbi:MAG: putative cytochrome dehydrogenase-related protein, partial [Phycisphaerales bacterium]|nr:putative cytochrome dehydrogenase-related protein [Phycisphaerales bacterium]
PSPAGAMDRRAFFRWLAAAAAAGPAAALFPGAFGRLLASDVPTPADKAGLGGAATRPARPLVRFPEKADLILLTDRPPNLETPIRFFREDLTPNEAFFVRWHLGGIPTSINSTTFRLTVGGHVGSPLSLSLDDLKKNFEPASIVAVNQCSGNGRALFAPRVPGGQWDNGGMGNAKWTGVRLADLLKKAGVKAGAVDVTFGGLDRSPLPTVAPFVKSIPVGHAKLSEAIVAYAMNDAPLPMLNGFPLRLVVPGWYATYWVKALSEVMVTPEKFAGFWMAKAYRIPTTPNMVEAPDALAKDTVPITDMTCRSVLVRPEPGERVAAGKAVEVEGVAFDRGTGIAKVEVSVDGGKTWAAAALDKDLGKYSFRRFRFAWTPAAGRHTVMARATNAAGETQTTEQWNRAGYGRNVIEAVTVEAA